MLNSSTGNWGLQPYFAILTSRTCIFEHYATKKVPMVLLFCHSGHFYHAFAAVIDALCSNWQNVYNLILYFRQKNVMI